MYKNRGGQTLSDKQEKDIMEQEEQKELQETASEENIEQENQELQTEEGKKEEEIHKTLEEESKKDTTEKRIYINNEEDLKKILRESFGNSKNNKNPKKLGGKFNFVGFLLLVFIVAVVLSFPKFMKDSKSGEELHEVSYTSFVKSIDEKKFQRIEEREGYLYGYLSGEKEEFRLNVSEEKNRNNSNCGL